MHPIHDTDLLLILALAVAAKRKPATLDDSLLAIAMLQEAGLPSEPKLLDSFARLSSHGLLVAQGEGYTLTAAAQSILASLPRKGDTEERSFRLKEKLAAAELAATHCAVKPDAAALSAAVAAWQAAQPPLTKSEKAAQRNEGKQAPSKSGPHRFGARPKAAGPRSAGPRLRSKY